MIRDIPRFGLALGLFALVGCGGGEQTTMEDMPTPSEAAQVINQNPSTRTIDVPATPVNEAARAGDDTGAASDTAPAPSGESTPPADPASEQDGDATETPQP